VHAAASFEDLEQDSLDFVEVQVSVKKRYRVDLVPDLFANGTIANVGQLVDYIVAETVVVEA
jgi:acyl carrier protein